LGIPFHITYFSNFISIFTNNIFFLSIHHLFSYYRLLFVK
jgi:hypothetical protein